MAIYKIQSQTKDGQDIQTAGHHPIDDDQALHVHERAIIELIATTLEHKTFLSVTNTLVNELAKHLECERVSLRLSKDRQHAPHAISSSAGVNPESKLVNLIAEAMDEALDQKTAIVYPSSNEDALLITSAHERLANSHSQKHIYSVLLTHKHEIIGVITLERFDSKPFTDKTLLFCERVGLLVGPLILLKYEEDNWLKERALGSIKRFWSHLNEQGHYSEKTLYGFGAILLLVLIFATGTHRVTGDAILEGKVQRMITAPVDGFIAEVNVRAGDIVKANQLMASLDDKELQLQEMKLKGEYDSYSREYRDARAKYDLTQVGITSAKMQQAKAELDIVKEQLRRLQMIAPFDGVVVEGNLQQTLGSPVERGQVLLKIAPLNDYRIILKVDDRDIAWVNTQQTGQLVLASLPGEVMPFTIKNITPVSIADTGRNYFKVEAKLEQKNTLLRPGMHGIAKIEVGERKLMWIWFHRFTDWLRFTLWSL